LLLFLLRTGKGTGSSRQMLPHLLPYSDQPAVFLCFPAVPDPPCYFPSLNSQDLPSPVLSPALPFPRYPSRPVLLVPLWMFPVQSALSLALRRYLQVSWSHRRSLQSSGFLCQVPVIASFVFSYAFPLPVILFLLPTVYLFLRNFTSRIIASSFPSSNTDMHLPV